MAFEPFRLSKEMKKELLDIEGDIKMMALEIARAKRAGLDVVDMEADYNKAVKLREGILKEYG